MATPRSGGGGVNTVRTPALFRRSGDPHLPNDLRNHGIPVQPVVHRTRVAVPLVGRGAARPVVAVVDQQNLVSAVHELGVVRVVEAILGTARARYRREIPTRWGEGARGA